PEPDLAALDLVDRDERVPLHLAGGEVPDLGVLEHHRLALRHHAVEVGLEALDVVEPDAEPAHHVRGPARTRIRRRHVLVVTVVGEAGGDAVPVLRVERAPEALDGAPVGLAGRLRGYHWSSPGRNSATSSS